MPIFGLLYSDALTATKWLVTSSADEWPTWVVEAGSEWNDGPLPGIRHNNHACKQTGLLMRLCKYGSTMNLMS